MSHLCEVLLLEYDQKKKNGCNNILPAAAPSQPEPSSQTTAAPSARRPLGWPGWRGETLDPDSWDTGSPPEPCGEAAAMPGYSDRTSGIRLWWANTPHISLRDKRMNSHECEHPPPPPANIRGTGLWSSHHSRSVWRCLEKSVDCYTEYSWGCNRCPEATADRTAQYTEGHQAEIHSDLSDHRRLYITPAFSRPLTLLWFETRQCSHTFTRCSKQNRLVTFLFGHLQSPIVTCAVAEIQKHMLTIWNTLT